MTGEQAVYFKLLLANGYAEEMKAYIDRQLEEQEIPYEIILELAYAGNDVNKLISALNEYTLKREIDYDGTVFRMVLDFIGKEYRGGRLSVKEAIDLMGNIAWMTKRQFDLPWENMYLMSDYFSDAQSGWWGMSMEKFEKQFEIFLDSGIWKDTRFVK